MLDFADGSTMKEAVAIKEETEENLKFRKRLEEGAAEVTSPILAVPGLFRVIVSLFGFLIPKS